MNAATLAPSRIALMLLALGAMTFGAFAAIASPEWSAFVVITLAFALAALTLPRPLVAYTLAALVPLQIYFTIPGTNSTLRGAFVFVVFAAVRVFATQRIGTWRRWMILPSAFLFVALVAALDAPNRYAALRGVYDWLAVFIAAFVAHELIDDARTLRRVIFVFVAAGFGEAIFGLMQSALGVERVIDFLRAPPSEWFFQPNLLRDQLADMTFNWILDARVLPFGNFINGIDYAIFVAAMFALALALWFGSRTRNEFFILLACVGAMGAAVALTLKGSGAIALGAGALVVMAFAARRASSRALTIGVVAMALALILALPFAGIFIERANFLFAREFGSRTEAGRLAIWANLISLWWQNPFRMLGLNNVTTLIAAVPTSFNGGTFGYAIPAAESAYVSLLLETGAIGFCVFAFFIATILRNAFRNATRIADPVHVGILAAIVALLAGNFTVTGLTTEQNGMALGMLIGMVFTNWTLDK